MSHVAENKKAHLEYEFIDTYEAGMNLTGQEVKSLRAGKATLLGSRVVVRGGEAFLIGASIPPYQVGNTPKHYDPERSRRLLLSKKELQALEGAESQGGLTLVPISVYNKGRVLKIDIGVGVGKKKFDKRESIKKGNVERDTHREYSDR